MPPSPIFSYETLSDKELFLWYASQWIKHWYLWGGDDPMGMDCSGLVIECCQAVGKLPERYDNTANGLWLRWQEFEVPFGRPGRIVFWGNDEEMKHVEICVTPYVSIGARGAGKSIQTIEDAIKNNAYVKMRPIHCRNWKWGPPRFVDIFDHPTIEERVGPVT